MARLQFGLLKISADGKLETPAIASGSLESMEQLLLNLLGEGLAEISSFGLPYFTGGLHWLAGFLSRSVNRISNEKEGGEAHASPGFAAITLFVLRHDPVVLSDEFLHIIKIVSSLIITFA